MLTISLFSIVSPVFEERIAQVKQDIEQLQQGNYSTSLGYRLALWDVGLGGIAKRPLFGHGTGMPDSYFENEVVTYKGGIYKDLPNFHKTTHYHNDWIEIGMHIGAVGILALMFFMWGWYQTFKVHHHPILGIALVSYIFLAGLTDTFIIYSRISTLLLVITAITVCWDKNK
jgi:O-antigen ligase